MALHFYNSFVLTHSIVLLSYWMSHYKKSIERLLEIAECLLFCCREFWKVCLLFHTFDFYTFKNYTFESVRVMPVGINEKGFVNSDFGMFLLLDYCIENERGSVGTPLCRVLINISSKSSKIVYFSQNCYFHVM